MLNTRFNASWNTEANTCMCHIILCFEVILSVTFQLFGMQKNGVITAWWGVCVYSPVILSLKECRSIEHTWNNPHHYCAVFLTWLLLYIVGVFHYLNMCFLCVNLRLSVFSVVLICFYHLPNVYAFMHLL